MKLHDRQLGPSHPAFLIAEIGINHNGDMVLARAAIDAAVKAGADAVKFQNYETEDFVSDRTLTFTYRSQGREITESQYELFKRCELSETMLMELASHCAEKGTCFLSTPTGDRGVEALVRPGIEKWLGFPGASSTHREDGPHRTSHDAVHRDGNRIRDRRGG